MDKKNVSKKTPVIMVLGVILAALLLCLGVVLIIRAINVGKKGSTSVVSSNTEKTDEYMDESSITDSNTVLTELEEVRVYLEELESAVNDSTLSIDTLTKNKEADDRDTEPIMEKLTELSSRVEKTKKEISLMIDGINSSEMNDLNVILGGFVKITQEVDKIREEMAITLEDIQKVGAGNSEQLRVISEKMQISLNTSSKDFKERLESATHALENKLATTTDTLENKFAATTDALGNRFAESADAIGNKIDTTVLGLGNNIDIMAENIKNQLNTLAANQKDYTERFNSIDATLEQVFQSVSNGKKMLAAAITDKKVDVPSDIAAFEVYCELIRRIGADSGAVDAQKVLEGTVVYDGLNNEYVSGNIPDHGYQDNYCPDFSDQKYYEAGYYPNGWLVDTNPAYQKGYVDGKAEIYNAHVSYSYHEHKTGDGQIHEADFHSPTASGCFTNPHRYVSGTVTKYAGCPGACVSNPNMIEVSFGVMERYAECNICGRVGGYGEGCGKMTEYTENIYSIDYYTCSCGKTDYQTAGENATIIGASISFE